MTVGFHLMTPIFVTIVAFCQVPWTTARSAEKEQTTTTLSTTSTVDTDSGNFTYVRGCYFTNWARYRRGRGKYFPEEYMPELCTHIFFAFGWMSEDFKIKAYDYGDLDQAWEKGLYRRVNDLKEHDPQLKTLVSVGGWTFGTRLFKMVSKLEKDRKTFIDSTIDFCREHNFDGLDIDWEYPDNDEDMENFNLLIKETRLAYEEEANKTGNERLLITAAVSAGDDKIVAGYDIKELGKWFDFVNVMTYDFHGTWEMTTGMNSPLFGREGEEDNFLNWNVDAAARIWAEGGMPKHKIIIGLASYGRGWTIPTPDEEDGVGIKASGKANRGEFTGEGGIASWYEICEMLADGAKSVWHNEHKVPYLVYGNQWFSYDDERSIRNKMRWLKWHGYGGAFIWTLDFDDFNAECSNNDDGKRYPLIRIMGEELADIHEFQTLPPYTTTTPAPPTHPPLPTHPWQSTTVTGLPTTPSLPPKAQECEVSGNGFHMHPDSLIDPLMCTKFIACHEGRKYGVMDCPPGLDFSNELHHCTLRGQAKCRPDTTTTSTTTTTTTTTRLTTTRTTSAGQTTTTVTRAPFDCQNRNGFFEDKTDCNAFYRCDHNKAHRFTCPGNLHYEPVTKLCIDPRVSECRLSNRALSSNEIYQQQLFTFV